MLESGQPSRVDSWPLDEGPLSSHLRWWLKTLSPTGRDKFSARLLFWLRTSKIAMTTSVVTLLVGISDVAVSRSMHEASVPVTLSLGVYSSVFAHVLFVKRLPALLQTVALLLATTAGVERHLDSASQKRMRRTARRGSLFCRQLVLFSVCLMLQFPAVYALTNDPQWSLRWIYRLHADSTDNSLYWLHWAAFMEQAFGLVCSFTAFYTMLPLVIVIYSTCADLHAALAHRMQLIASGLKLGAYSLGTAAPILIVFVPLCEVGDRLSRARRGVAESAAEGPWVEERPKQRQLRLAVMQAAMGEGAFLRGSGIGPLDRATCGNALRSWFSFLQVILNVQRKAGVH
ncbi:uncharacterized protein LOC127749044 isoform X2 [Frankliniella occidentalis]|uniref:Uncharacterized protein LOC127749044 isoform X2 n=1 Tax=Frankliniella occidentalis TaxID=133901 RepID=A0A9C6TWC6_FRAOC|nr:uncharacterized protein LOC127749044 isoform X2 [Frankliniella occidentalis]